MRKFIPFLVMLVISFCLSGCARGDVSRVSIHDQPSRIYTEKEIRQAVNVAMEYFEKEFDGCVLLGISYVGDDMGKAFIEWANRYDVDQVIILVSDFTVGPEGGDGSLNPNDTYRNWQWILGRSGGGQWKHLDHGYG